MLRVSTLLFVDPGVKGVQVPTLHIGEEVLYGRHNELVGPQVHHRDLQFQESGLDKLALVVRGIVQHEDSFAPPVPLKTVECSTSPQKNGSRV